MQQALLIFRKDVRHLWPSILIVTLLTAAHAFFDVRSWPVDLPQTNQTNGIANLLTVLLPLGIAFLIAQLIFQEALPGDRQFWLTRPYRWSNLLASKILFIFVFISIPLFVSDCYILGVQEFPVLSVLPKLLLRQVFLAVYFVLPSLALAAVTTGLPQFLLAWFIFLLVLVSEAMLYSPNTNFEISSAVFDIALAATCCGVVIWQYVRRWTTTARLALLAVACGFFPAARAMTYWPVLHAATPALPESPTRFNIQIAYDLGRTPSTFPRPGPFVPVRVPLSVVGLPPNTLLRGFGPVTIKLGGRVWSAPGQTWFSGVERGGDGYWQTLQLPASKVKEVNRQPVSIHTSFDFELVTDQIETSIPLDKPSFFANHLGLCQMSSDRTNLTCRTGLSKAVETTVNLGPTIATISEYTTPRGLSPTTNTLTTAFDPGQAPAELTLTPRHQLARFNRTLDLPDIQLSRYLPPQ